MQASPYGPSPYLPITERKHFAWPHGNRLALWIIPNIEFFHLDDPMPGVNNDRLPAALIKIPNVRNWALRDYGNRLLGWLGAGLAESWNTLDYLFDEGVRYFADWTADDLPFRMNVGGKTIMSIPYSLQVNDATQFYNRKSNPEDLEKTINAQFDCPYAESERLPRVMAIALHPFVSGAPYWNGALNRAFDNITSKPGVWLATGSEIIDHFVTPLPDEWRLDPRREIARYALRARNRTRTRR